VLLEHRSLALVLAEIDTELLELPVKMRALETRLLGNARHGLLRMEVSGLDGCDVEVNGAPQGRSCEAKTRHAQA